MSDKAKTVASALRLIVGGDFATVGGEKVIRMAAELLDEQAIEILRLRAEAEDLRLACAVMDASLTECETARDNRMRERDEARLVAQSLLKEHADFDQERELIERYPWIDYYGQESH